MLWFASLATVAYWVVWFAVDRRWLATLDTPAYYTFENAFPLADAWMAVTSALGAVALRKRDPRALLWMLLAGSASVYLGLMDVLFDAENRVYFQADAGSLAVEIFINTGCLAGGLWIIAFAWRHRALVSATQSPNV